VPNELTGELQAALFDLQRYLLDQIPPLTASDAVESLMAQPPELMVRQIHSWAVEQSRHHSAAMSDFLFHAIRKVYLISMLKLVERQAMDRYLTGIVPLAMQVCPAEERELLRSSVEAMRNSIDIGSAVQGHDGGGVAKLGGSGKPAAPPAAGVAAGTPGDDAARSARRLSMVVERLARYIPGGAAAIAASSAPETPQAPGPVPAIPQAAPQLVIMAAASSTSEAELDAYIEKLSPYTGGETDRAKLFRLLAAGVPGWEIDVDKPSASIEAMHKIISLTPTALESMQRFRELLMEAVEQFNNGALAAAVSMLELANAIPTEKKLDPNSVERARAVAADAISGERLRKYAENKTKHFQLRKALSYFPTLTKESLLQQLRGEQRPERRRALLGLLEAYGQGGRLAALPELENELNRPPADVDTYYLRNLIYLLHRIPRDSEDGLQKEMDLLTRASARGQSIYVIKEAVTPLGHIKNEASTKLLTMRLAEFEAMLLRKDPTYPVDETHKLLDRIITALNRIASPAALLTIARHGMKPNPLLGDTRARLALLASHDLSFDEETVNIIVNPTREDLPKKVFGRPLPQLQPPPIKLIESLSSTRSEVVENLFAEIVEKFPDHDVGKAASAALAFLAQGGKPATASQVATLTGDLQFFGLPSLMQSLGEQQATGIVTLTGAKSGGTAGKLLFLNGKFVDAQASQLRGVDALYQMLERPIVGTFAFVPQQATNVKVKSDPLDIMPLLFEGIRRHDELNQTSILVPDDLKLKATSTKPTPDPEENDPAIVRDVWVKASAGGPLVEWEAQVAADPYRVRRLVARWLEEGALQPVSG